MFLGKEDTSKPVASMESQCLPAEQNKQNSLFQDISCLTNCQLREKLIDYGEQPGPINDFTRGAYLSYLNKIIQGIQPAGNKGYKGNI